MRRVFVLPTLALSLLAAAVCRADDVRLSTHNPSPTGRYRQAIATRSLQVGLPASPGNAWFYGDLVVEKLPAAGTAVCGAPGGTLTVTQDLQIRDAGGTSLLYVDGTNNRVGIGTVSPRFAAAGVPLDVEGPLRSNIIKAYADENTWYAGSFELYGAQDAFENNPLDERVVAACAASPVDYDALPLYIDGDPLVFQSVIKPGVALNGGRGELVIKGEPALVDGVILTVGFAGATTYGRILARPGVPSTIASKKQVSRMEAGDLGGILDGLDQMTLAHYRYKDESVDSSPHFGFIADDAPRVVRTKGGIALNEMYGYLFAATKALKADQERLARRLEALKQ
jgi:hypothetical protein